MFFRSVARSLFAVIVAFVATFGLRPLSVGAQTTLLAPTPIAPTVPVGPAGRSLGSAYTAILGAQQTNPSAAASANIQYLIARQRLAAGDVSGALAAAAIARSLALTPASDPLRATNAAAGLGSPILAQPVPGVGTLRRAPLAPTGTTPATAPVPLAGGALSMQLLVARNEIDLAERLTGADLSLAKARYRAALDRYQSGDAAGANAAASDAYERAAKALGPK